MPQGIANVYFKYERVLLHQYMMPVNETLSSLITKLHLCVNVTASIFL
jgi:hypothetical protein